MHTVARRKLASHSSLFHHQRSLAASSGLGKISARELKYLRPASRQYSSLLSSSGRARPRGLRLGQTLFRQIHARAISYSSIPRFVARAFRVPIAGATVGAGGLTYANYKYEGTLWLALSPSIIQYYRSNGQNSRRGPKLGSILREALLRTPSIPLLKVSNRSPLLRQPSNYPRLRHHNSLKTFFLQAKVLKVKVEVILDQRNLLENQMVKTLPSQPSLLRQCLPLQIPIDPVPTSGKMDLCTSPAS